MALELIHSLDNNVFGRQECGTETYPSRFLTKPRSRYHADPRLFQKRESIQGVRTLTVGCSGLERLLRKIKSRKSIHGSLAFIALNSIDRVESVNKNLRSTLEALVDLSFFLHEQIVRFSARLGRLEHEGAHDLTGHARAQTGRSKLIELCLNIWVNVMQFHIPSTAPTFTYEAFARRVKTNELQILALRILQSDLLRRDKLLTVNVNIALVHLICQKDNTILCAKATNNF
mmetsp:Transcript_18617/g.40513  ORF Transcript_18617/g.40513 Transcript_18617/m.40513 type:complete len:231 (+) Transcript_18617:135-827(+)